MFDTQELQAPLSADAANAPQQMPLPAAGPEEAARNTSRTATPYSTQYTNGEPVKPVVPLTLVSKPGG